MHHLNLVLVAAALGSTPLYAQNHTAPKPPATRSNPPKLPIPSRSTPLADRERAVQLLNRFTFGPRPGDVEHVLAQTPEKWFEQQLNPASINDDALNRRLADYPTPRPWSCSPTAA